MGGRYYYTVILFAPQTLPPLLLCSSTYSSSLPSSPLTPSPQNELKISNLKIFYPLLKSQNLIFPPHLTSPLDWTRLSEMR